MRLGTTEIILIVVLALVLFGGGKLAGVGKALRAGWVQYLPADVARPVKQPVLSVVQ